MSENSYDIKVRCPEFFYHNVLQSSMAMRYMEILRIGYIELAQQVLNLCPPGRSKDLALEELQVSLMRAIQSLALTCDPIDPRPKDGRAENLRESD